MPPREDRDAALPLPALRVLLLPLLEEDEALEQRHERVAAQHVLPEVGDGILARLRVVAGAPVGAFAAPPVEGEKLGLVAGERRRHVYLALVEREEDDAPGERPEQARCGVPVSLPLRDGILPVLPRAVGLELHRGDGDAVGEDHQVDTFPVARPDLLRHGEDVVLVALGRLRVPVRGRQGREQLQMHVLEVEAMLQDVQRAAGGLRHLGVERRGEDVVAPRAVALA